MNEVFEIVIRALAEIFFEVLIRGPGWVIFRLFSRSKEANPDGCLVLAVGLSFWMLLGASVWGVLLLL